MFDLSGRVVLVTGASGGIGRAIALELARAGAEVVVHHRASPERAEEVRAAIGAAGSAALIVAGDVTDPDGTNRFVHAAGDWKGRLDGVVTAAGIYRRDASDRVTPVEFALPLRTNLEGTFWTLRAALPYLRKSVRPAVVTISSVFGAHAGVGGVAHQAAKAGVEQATRSLALELAPRIRVNAVAPGFIRTNMTRTGRSNPAFDTAIATATPLGRWGTPEDVAPSVRFLLSLEADWVTGLVFPVDGGIALR